MRGARSLRIAYLTRAGGNARQEYALDEAIEYYRELLPLLSQRGSTQAVALVLFKLDLIERARQERSDRSRLALFHEADRMAVADQVALIPLVYGRSMAFVKPAVQGWWEFGKSSAAFADLLIAEDDGRPRARTRRW